MKKIQVNLEPVSTCSVYRREEKEKSRLGARQIGERGLTGWIIGAWFE